MKFLLEFHPICLWKNRDANLDILIPELRLLPQSGGNRRRKRGRWGSISYFTGARFVCWCIFHSLGNVLGNLRNIKWMPTGVLIWGDNLLEKNQTYLKIIVANCFSRDIQEPTNPLRCGCDISSRGRVFSFTGLQVCFVSCFGQQSGRHDIMWPLGLIL